MFKKISIILLIIIVIVVGTTFVSSAKIYDKKYVEVESNNTVSTANILINDCTVYGEISSAEDIDCYMVVLDSEKTVGLLVYSDTTDFVTYFYDSDLNLRGVTTKYEYDSNTKMYYSALTGTLEAGTYYIAMADKNSATQGYVFYYFEADEEEAHTHSYTKKVTKKATCTTSGTETYTCSCGDSYTKTIPAKGHSFTNYVSDNNATYVKDSTKTAICDNGCDETDCITETGTRKQLKTTGAIKVTQSGMDFTLSWNKVTGAMKYRVFQRNGSSWKKLTDTSSRSYKIKLVPGKTYKFAVRPFATDGTTNYFSSKYDTVDVTAKLQVTSNITVTQKGANFVLAWESVGGATGYRVYQYVSGKWKTLVDTSSRSYTAKKLTVGKTYKYAIKAYAKTDAGVVYAPSYKTITFIVGPEDSTITKATQTTSSIKLTWTKSTGATGYYVFRYKNNEWVAVGSTTSTSMTVKNLSSGTKYKFAVRPYVVSGSETVWSNGFAEYTTSTKTKTPANFKLTSSAKGKVTASWSNVAGETGFQLYYSTSKDSGYKKVSNYIANTTSTTVSGLTSGKTYYFKLRAYKNSGNGYVYSAYSPVVSVKVK